VSADLRPEIIEAFHDTPFSTPVIGVTGGKGGGSVRQRLPSIWQQQLPQGERK